MSSSLVRGEYGFEGAARRGARVRHCVFASHPPFNTVRRVSEYKYATVRMSTRLNAMTGRPRDPAVDKAIRQATLELVEQHGYRGVSIEGIAARSGVSKQTI